MPVLTGNGLRLFPNLHRLPQILERIARKNPLDNTGLLNRTQLLRGQVSVKRLKLPAYFRVVWWDRLVPDTEKSVEWPMRRSIHSSSTNRRRNHRSISSAR